MARFEIRKDGDTYHVSGHMDEHTDFSPLLETPDNPLKLSLEGVSSINSVGTKALMTLSKDLGKRVIEFHDVPTFLIELINVVPALIGKRSKNVVSLFVPYHCTTCNSTVESLVKRSEVRTSHRGTEAPTRQCGKCQGSMRMKGEEEDMFLFLTYSA